MSDYRHRLPRESLEDSHLHPNTQTHTHTTHTQKEKESELADFRDGPWRPARQKLISERTRITNIVYVRCCTLCVGTCMYGYIRSLGLGFGLDATLDGFKITSTTTSTVIHGRSLGGSPPPGLLPTTMAAM